MGYRFGGLVPRFYCGRHKLLPELLTSGRTHPE
jgi:phosphatidylglycerophosphatase C